MRIAHLDTGREWRGGQQQVLWLLEGLARQGVESLLLAPPGPLLERARAAGLLTREWRSLGEWDVLAAITAADHLKEFGPDLAHLHSAHAHTLGALAAWMVDGPPVVVSRRVDFAVATNPLSWLKYRLPVARYFCISRGVRDVMRMAGIPEGRLALVPSGVRFASAAEVAAAPSLAAELGLAADAPIVGTVAALAPHKNHADLMRSAARVIAKRPDAHFVWIGEGECRGALEAQRGSLGLEANLHLLGFRPGARAMIPQFRLFALASYLEGLCTSIIDAQSLGVPVIATRTGGIPDLIDHDRTGFLTPPRDPDAMAEAILECLADPARGRAWAAAAGHSVQAFSADGMVERTLEEYRELTGTRPAASGGKSGSELAKS